MKRLQENPWEVLARKYKINDIIKAPVSRISQFGAFLDLEGGIQGLIHLSEISHGVVRDIREHIKVGQDVEAKIINFDPITKRIGLSLKALVEAPVKTEETATAEASATEVKEKKAPAKKTAIKKEAAVEAPKTEEITISGEGIN
jgi:small subunit ribosomal protein S1